MKWERTPPSSPTRFFLFTFFMYYYDLYWRSPSWSASTSCLGLKCLTCIAVTRILALLVQTALYHVPLRRPSSWTLCSASAWAVSSLTLQSSTTWGGFIFFAYSAQLAPPAAVRSRILSNYTQTITPWCCNSGILWGVRCFCRLKQPWPRKRKEAYLDMPQLSRLKQTQLWNAPPREVQTAKTK